MVALAVAMPYPEEDGPIVVSPEVLDAVVPVDLLASPEAVPSELAEGEKVDERYRPNYGHQAGNNFIETKQLNDEIKMYEHARIGNLQSSTNYQQQSSSHQQQSSSYTTQQQSGYQNTGYDANNAAGKDFSLIIYPL